MCEASLSRIYANKQIEVLKVSSRSRELNLGTSSTSLESELCGFVYFCLDFTSPVGIQPRNIIPFNFFLMISYFWDKFNLVATSGQLCSLHKTKMAASCNLQGLQSMLHIL